jgi:hypothetical protein
MASTINGTSTGSGGLISTGDDSGILNIQTNETTAITIDASQNIGVGVTPSAWSTGKNLQLAGSKTIVTSNDEFYLASNSYFDGTNNKYIANGFATQYSQETGVHKWFIAPTGTAGNNITFTRGMTLDASGRLGVGTTSPTGKIMTDSATSIVGVLANNTSGALALDNIQSRTSAPTTNGTFNYFGAYSDYWGAYRFKVLDSGNVQNTNNSYGAISDVKLKENIVDATPKLANLMQVKVRNYNMIGDTIKQIGVVAQELEAVFPAMVDETPDYEEVTTTDEDGNKKTERVAKGTSTKSVKYSVFVPMLIKAIQEQQAIIETLTQRITALEGA